MVSDWLRIAHSANIQGKYRWCSKSKRWTFTFRGRTVVLREKAVNIVKWLDRFKQVGDVASNADPVHIGLPWAGIRLLFQASTAECIQCHKRVEIVTNYV
jgi:hypothetical protein